MLLEVVLALALTVVVGLVILSAIGQTTDALRRAREKQVAVDLARTALAKLEAGIETTATISGPVPLWTEDANTAEVAQTAEFSGWELVVDTQPSGFDGLTLVSVTARRSSEELAPGDVGESGVSYTLRQVMRLSTLEEDGIGEKDDVSIAAERAAESPGRRPEPPPGRRGDQ